MSHKALQDQRADWAVYRARRFDAIAPDPGHPRIEQRAIIADSEPLGPTRAHEVPSGIRDSVERFVGI